MYPAIVYGSTLGADCSGVVEAVADPRADGWLVGQRVMVDPGIGWGPGDTPLPTYSILGMSPAPGTFADYTVVSGDAVVPIPPHLTPLEAASIPLAGLTAFRATVTLARVKRDDVVVVPGIGGGVALFCLQYAVALGECNLHLQLQVEWVDWYCAFLFRRFTCQSSGSPESPTCGHIQSGSTSCGAMLPSWFGFLDRAGSKSSGPALFPGRFLAVN